ncbi:hemolysin family protein [Microbaculum marinisediminis]|uniref:Hemolysin family protein n=1 Tax=Microbaculum marinisediminis TaxID=2931392 RepID=A0AAW5QW13_9HYPH|nr:hemolysin family protein [Microbaculum sp. A6E488]MCT8972135.1 hemolysin family protein [Microbaculum sp. A6E488]
MPDEPTPSPEEPASSSHSGGETLIRKLKHLFGHRQTSSSLRESLAGALDEADGVATDPFSAKERSMLRNVLGLRDLRVDDVMVPRADIDAVETDVPIAELIREFRDAGHSRLPVYKETLDEPCGMIHIKDLLGWMTERALLSQDGASADEAGKSGDLDMSRIPLKTSLAEAELVRQVLYVPPSMPAVDLLVKMQATRIHMAIVVDEYGGTDGLVSIEDLVEEIVGEIEDEHDEETAPMIVPTDDGGFIADARAPIEEVSKLLGEEIEIGDLVEDIDTLGGLVFDRAGHVPVRGELVSFPGGYEFEILDADPRRIKRVRIHRRAAGTVRSTRRERTDKERTDAGRPDGDRSDAA